MKNGQGATTKRQWGSTKRRTTHGEAPTVRSSRPASIMSVGAALQLLAVLGAAVPPKHAGPKPRPLGINPAMKASDPHPEDIATARRDLLAWGCPRVEHSSALPCKNATFYKSLAKIKDPSKRKKMVEQHQLEQSPRVPTTPEAKAAFADSAWLGIKVLYTAYCARGDIPLGSKVCTNVTLKTAFSAATRPKNWSMGGSARKRSV